jgi:hypothetical protein
MTLFFHINSKRANLLHEQHSINRTNVKFNSNFKAGLRVVEVGHTDDRLKTLIFVDKRGLQLQFSRNLLVFFSGLI